jgi:hypothetical protein
LNTNLDHRLGRYKRKFYLNLIFKGSIYILTTLISAFLFISLLEYQFHSGSVIRGLLFFGYLLACVYVLYKWLFVHLLKLFLKSRQISDENAAKKIGSSIPEIEDKLVNLVQLRQVASSNSLLKASIAQRSRQMSKAPIEQIISYRDNLKYLKYLALPFLVLAMLAFTTPKTITEPTKRIVQFRKEFVPIAPFNFNILNENLRAFKNEDFALLLELSGQDIPESVYLVSNNRRIKLQKTDDRHYQHQFEKMQQEAVFHFEAAGFRSETHNIKVLNRPNIKNFAVRLSYPDYINKENDLLDNIGSFQVPAGTQATWMINTSYADEIAMQFQGDDGEIAFESVIDQMFTYEKVLIESDAYLIELRNEHSLNKDIIKYNIEVIPDEFPKINLDQLKDTVLFEYLIFGGNISDDYGLTDLNIFFKKVREQQESSTAFTRLPMKIDRSKNNQSFYYRWDLEAFELSTGEQIEYYLQVRDNDAINGSKASKTPTYTFRVPSKEKLKNELNISSQKSENQIDRAIEQSKQLNQELKEIQDEMKGKKEMSWQDQKQIEEMIQRKNALEKAIEELQQQFNSDLEKRDRFDEGLDEETKEKLTQLQQLMNELLDDETKALYEELQRLLEENSDLDQMKNIIDQLNSKENNLEKELERTLELFRKMKFEMKLNEALNETRELQNQQEKAAENSQDKQAEQEALQQEQEGINEQFQELKEDLSEMQDLNQDLKRPQPMPDFSEEIESVEQQQKQAGEQLKQNKNKKAGKAQQGASQQMKKMADKMASMQSMMMQSSMNLNFNQLRDILDNLIKLSFDQEQVMQEFRKVHQSDPRFLKLSQQQLKIKDDAKVIQDSLISLSKDDFRIQSMVTRKVDEMNEYLGETADAIKERQRGEAIGKQQFAMTAINDLALMLDDVMSQMMNAMGMGGGDPQNARVPSMSELQMQLAEKIQELKKSGMSGRQLSEELAKMAAEQERIRQMLQEMEEKMEKGEGTEPGNSLDDITKKMELSELDLVNKRLTDQLIRRQQEIVTRLLEAEKAEKERELDDEREGQRANDVERNVPAAFDEYIKAKEREIELLKTIPPKLNPYYKKEVSDYFKRLGTAYENEYN